MTDPVQPRGAAPHRGRPPDPNRRAATLAAVTDHVLVHGLAGSSLRPLAAALGVSHRMLLYDFGSKEALLQAALAEARRRLAVHWQEEVRDHRETPAGTDAVRTAWLWLSDPAQQPYLQLFFEVQLDAVRRPDAHAGRGAAMTRDWLQLVTEILARETPGAGAPGPAPDPETDAGPDTAADADAGPAAGPDAGLAAGPATVADAGPDAAAEARATLAVAAIRGLTLDRLTTGDVERTDRAVDLLVAALGLSRPE